MLHVWVKGYRTILFATLYEVLYWGESFSYDNIDLCFLEEQYKYQLSDEEKRQIMDYISYFLIHQNEMTDILKKELVEWSKTFLLVKAVLFTGLIEKTVIPEHASDDYKKGVVSKYIHLTQDMLGGKNPALVHAVLGKLYDV